MTPLYNHVSMAFQVIGDDLQPLCKEILSFLWVKSVSAETFLKRRLVPENDYQQALAWADSNLAPFRNNRSSGGTNTV
jgi:hypothetical protein